jgi:glucose-6-phosphate 1-dehydrogenase
MTCVPEEREPIPDQGDRNTNVVEGVDTGYGLQRDGHCSFEPLWNRDHIDHIQITAAETVGVEGRGRFYEQTGALRDMVPNHLFQLLAMIGMEPPISFDADAVRGKKTV